jgi:hypothetical protein
MENKNIDYKMLLLFMLIMLKPLNNGSLIRYKYMILK